MMIRAATRTVSKAPKQILAVRRATNIPPHHPSGGTATPPPSSTPPPTMNPNGADNTSMYLMYGGAGVAAIGLGYYFFAGTSKGAAAQDKMVGKAKELEGRAKGAAHDLKGEAKEAMSDLKSKMK